MGDTESGRKRYLVLGEEGTGKTTFIRIITEKPIIGSNGLELYEVTFEGHKISLIDGRNMHEYRKHNPDNSEIDIVVLTLSHESLNSPFKEIEEQMKETFGEKFRKTFLFLILCDPKAKTVATSLSKETDELISNADKSFQRLYKRYCWGPLTIELPHHGFPQTTEFFKNLIEMHSEKTIKSNRNDLSTLKVLVIRNETETEASLVRNLALSIVRRTEKADFFYSKLQHKEMKEDTTIQLEDMEEDSRLKLEDTEDNITFIDTPPLNELLANRDFFEDPFSQIDTIVLLVKEAKLPMPSLLTKLKEALGQKFYNRMVIGINLFGENKKRKYYSIKDSVSALLEIYHSDPKVFLLPDLASNSGRNLFNAITELLKSPERITPTLEELKESFVLIPGGDNNLEERIMKEVVPDSVCVTVGDAKIWEVREDSYSLIYLNLPPKNESGIHKTFLQICKEGVHLIILDEEDTQTLEYLRNILSKDVEEFIFQFKTKEDLGHQDVKIKLKIEKTLSSPIKMQDCSVLFIGENGSGKSSSINTILGRSVFETGHIWSMTETITKDVQRYTYVNENYDVAFGRNITLIDTPNFETLEGKRKFTKAIQSGIDVVVMVVKIDRLTPYRLEFFAKIPQLFQIGVFDDMMVVFTFGETLHGKSIDEFIETGGEKMKQFVKKINGRYVTFCNTSRDQVVLQQHQKDFFTNLDLIVRSKTGKALTKC